MVWLLDIGNSRIKWAALTGNDYKYGDALDYKCHSIDYVIDAIALTFPLPEKIFISSVTSIEFKKSLSEGIKQRFNLECSFIYSSESELGIINQYENPAQLGVDRWLSVLAAYNFSRTDCLVVDAGSAITVDFVSSCIYQGGVIAPGLKMMTSALVANTSLVYTDDDVSLSDKIFATNTRQAISSGCIHMALGLIDRFYMKASTISTTKLNGFITGGDGLYLMNYLDSSKWQYVPDLVLQGMSMLVKQQNLS